MDNGQFDKIREKLYNVQMPVDADIWSGIESSLRRRRIRRLFYYASAAAATIILALFVLVPGEEKVQTTALVAHQTETSSSRQLPPAANSDATEALTQTAPAEPAQPASPASPAAPVAPTTVPAADNTPSTADQQKNASDTKQESTMKTIKADISGLESYLAEDSPALKNPKGKKNTVSFSSSVLPGSTASVSGTMIRATSAGAGNLTQSYTVEQISDTKYSLPLNLGIQFQFPAGENMALGIGANYTMLRSKYDCLINKKRYNVKQTLHYIGIPVNIYGLVVDKNNFSFYVNAGGTVEKGIKAVYRLKSYDSSERNTADIDGLQFSLNAGMGMEYRFSNTVGLYLEPNIVYYFNSDIPRSIRTDQPLQVKAELGFRFRF